MKKFISFLIIAAMIFTTLPVFADSTEPKVTIKYITDGETYEAGSTVILGAETDIGTDVARVDFYANDIKIPGCITSLDKTLNWTIPTSGSYEIQAFLTTTAGAEAFKSEKITVNGVANEEEMVFCFDSASDVASHTYINWGNSQCTENDANSDFVKKSKYSAKWNNLFDNDTFYIKGLNANRIGDKYLNYLIYSTHDVTIHTRLRDNTLGYTRPENQNFGYFSLKPGWNSVSMELALLDVNGYYSAETRIVDINEIYFYTAFDNAIKTGYGLTNEGIGLKKQPNLADTTIYFDSAWLSDEPVAAPKATSSIPSGSTKVCNALDKLTFTFDKEMDFSLLSDADITVKNNTDNTEIENFTLIPSTNTLIVDFAPNILEYNKEYTVTLGDNIKDFYGKSVDSETKEFTFSTVQSCETVKPIVSLTYPKANATVTADNVTLAAKVIFGGTVTGVDFYDGEEFLKKGTKGADGEWYAADVTLSAGAHAVKAVVTYGDDATEKTEATSFTVSDALSYSFTGIFDGEQIPLNETAEPLVSKTIGINDTTGVSKVVYKLDGVEEATVTASPFTWEMPITKVNTDVALSADVYSVGVNAVGPVNYKAVYVKEISERDKYTDNFDKRTDGASISTSNSIFQQVSDRSGVFALKYANAESLGRDGIVAMMDRDETKTPSNSGLLGNGTGGAGEHGATIGAGTVNPIVKFTFDLYLPVLGNGSVVVRSTSNSSMNDIVICDLSKLSVNAWHSVEVYVDTASKALAVSIDDASSITYLTDALWTKLLTKASGDSNAKIFIAFCSYNDLYIDNVRTVRIDVDTTRNDLFVNGIKKDITASGETVNVSVANLSAANSTVSVLFALYNDDNEMLAVWTEENVSVNANELSQTIQNVPYTVDGKTGTIVKAFVLNNMNEITPVKTIR